MGALKFDRLGPIAVGDVPYPVPLHETKRVAALRELAILDTPRESAYEDIALVAATLCSAPIAVVNFVDAERQWGKALVGLASSEAPREDSFCARTIVQDDGLLVVRDAAADPQWADTALVRDGLRFYAGAAIVTADGHALGTVCVADTRPRGLTPRAAEALRALARQTAALLDLRRTSSWLVQANEQLHRMQAEDPLTGLANRATIQDRLTLALRTRLRTGRDVGVVLCDLAGFAQVNERFGHQGGDELLQAVGRRIAGQARGSDTVARLAADEFVVLCPGLAAADDVQVVVDRVREAVEQPLRLRGTDIVPRAAVGAVVTRPGEDAEAVLRRALAETAAAKRLRR